MNKVKLTKYINITSFVLLLSALVNVASITDVNKLKNICILSIVLNLMDLLRDIWDSKAGD